MQYDGKVAVTVTAVPSRADLGETVTSKELAESRWGGSVSATVVVVVEGSLPENRCFRGPLARHEAGGKRQRRQQSVAAPPFRPPALPYGPVDVRRKPLTPVGSGRVGGAFGPPGTPALRGELSVAVA